jgi:DNA-directed RNA polymerase specialized sigma24 family protein
MLKIEEMLTANNSRQLQELYNNYGGMLFGYIFEIVKDKKLAETYLLKVFASISKEEELSDHEEISSWAQVFRYAKHQLSSFRSRAENQPAKQADTLSYEELHPCLSRLNDEERKIFCDSYYYGKTIDTISTELNQPGALIRKTLRQAFITIRTSSGN